MYMPYDQSKPIRLFPEQAEAAAQEKMNKEILALNGVNAAQFTREKAISDLKEFFEWFCPQIKDWDVDYDALEVCHEFQPMGKKSIPKNVVKIGLFYNADKLNALNVFTVYFSYLADGRINSIDAVFRIRFSAILLKVRLKKSELVITEVKTTDAEIGSSTVVFKDNSPSDNIVSSQILDDCWEKLPSPKSDTFDGTIKTTPEDYIAPAINDTSFQPQTKSSKNENSTVTGCIGMMIGLAAIIFGIFSCTSCMG